MTYNLLIQNTVETIQQAEEHARKTTDANYYPFHIEMLLIMKSSHSLIIYSDSSKYHI
jgi:hypothetical protein